jgi:glycosyltransferase involved in cell wall biosynthesis
VEAFAPQARYPKGLLPRHRPWAQTDNSFAPADVPTKYFDYPALPFFSRYINGQVCARNLEPLIRESKPDLILNYWVYPDGYAAVKVAKRLGIPVVTYAIGTDLNRHLKGIVRSFTRWTLQQSDLVITVSGKLAERAVELGARQDRVVSIINGCDTTIFSPVDKRLAREQVGMDDKEVSFLYVGRFDVLKGLLELVRASAELAKANPNVRLTMVGEGPARAAIESLAGELGFRERLRLVGPCSSSSIARWMNATDVFALPSYAEGCPNVVVEALNCGTPVVATRVGGIPELVDAQRAILVEPRNSEALKTALQDALMRSWDKALIGRLSRRSWEDKAHELYYVCEAVVKQAPCSRTNVFPLPFKRAARQA